MVECGIKGETLCGGWFLAPICWHSLQALGPGLARALFVDRAEVSLCSAALWCMFLQAKKVGATILNPPSTTSKSRGTCICLTVNENDL